MTTSSRLTAFLTALDNPVAKAHRLTLAMLIIFGITLRIYAWYVGEAFLYYAISDELSAWKMAMRFLAGDPVAWYLGQPNFSSGQLPGPLWTLFSLGAYKLGGNSVHGFSLIVALLNSGVIYLTYRLARCLFTPRLAILAALLYATSPWTIYYSAGLWNPLVLAIFGVLLFITLWHVTTHDNSPHIFWVTVITAAVIQFHMIGIFYIPAILLLFWLAPTRLHRGWFIAGIITGAAFYLPYIWFDGHNHWQNTLAMLTSDERRSLSSLKIISVPITMLSFYPSSWIGYGFNEFLEFADRYFISRYVFIGLCLLSLGLATVMLGSHLRRVWSIWHGCHRQIKAAYRQQPTTFFIFILLVLPLILFMLTWHNYNSRYLVIALPLLIFIPLLYWQNLATNQSRHRLFWILITTTVINLYLVGVYYGDLQRRINTAALLMPSFHQLEKIADSLHQSAGHDNKIEVDIRDFPGYSSDSYVYILANAIQDYVNITESFVHQHTGQERVVRFNLLPDDKEPGQKLLVGYRGHGIQLVTVAPQ